MEWVIAILAIGCLFFAFQIVMDYIKHKAVVAPRLERLEAARVELEARIEEVRGQLIAAQSELEPAKKEVEVLEREYLELQEQIQEERAKSRRRSPMADGDGAGSGPF